MVQGSRFRVRRSGSSARRATAVLLLLCVAGGSFVAAQSGQKTDERVPALYRESYALEAKRDFAGALARMRDIRQAGGSTYFGTMRAAWLAYLAGDYAASAAAYTEAARVEPKAIEPRLGLTLPLLAGAKWRDLERACRDVLAIDARNTVAQARLAQALYWNANYPDAVATYQRLTADYPADLDYKTGLGWALLKMGRAPEARRIFEDVLAVSPDNVNAKQGMGAK